MYEYVLINFISLSNICISWKYNIQVRNCFLYCIHDIFGIITKVFLYSPAVQWAIFMKRNLRFRLFWASSSVKIPVIMLAIMITKGFNWIKIWISRMSSYVAGTSVTIMSPNDELSSTMNWVGCLLKDSELFILFAENSQILVKISVLPILLTFIYLVALNRLVNNQLNSLSSSTHHCGT